MNYLQLGILVLVGILLLAAAVQDFRSLTISNLWPALIIALFVPAYALGAAEGPLGSHLLHFGIALAVGMGLFALDGVGGGDAKLYAATALWLPFGSALSLFVSVVLAGLFLAVVFVTFRLVQTRELRARAIRKGKIPYGLAIAAGAITALPRLIA